MADNHLSRADIDSILHGMTARDIFAAMPGGTVAEVKGAEVAGKAFESAAERQGHGPLALDRVAPADAIYLAQELGTALDAGPKAQADDTES